MQHFIFGVDDEMTHQEKMEYWNATDPISYYEMTDDPMAGSSGPGIGLVLLIILIVSLLIILL